MKPQELKDLNETELRQKEKDLTAELFNLRFQHATGQLENTERLPLVRKDLARVKTFLRAKNPVPAKAR